jgi:hypothetical protein
MPTETCNRVLVERHFLGEGDAEEKRAARAHLDGCAGCRGRLAAFENERREYLLAHPFRDFAARHLPEGIAERARPKRAFASSRWLPAAAGLAACLVLLPVLFKAGLKPKAHSDEGIRAKGGALLEYYVKRGGAVTPGSPAEAYRPGDELQFVCASGSYAYVTLASIDSRGHVSLYRTPAGAQAPTAGARGAAALSLPGKGGEKQSLPFAVTLDDSPGAELFVMIFGAAPLSGEAVESWLTGAYTRASGNLEALPSVLSPPPGSGDKAPAGIKTLLLRKTQA